MTRLKSRHILGFCWACVLPGLFVSAPSVAEPAAAPAPQPPVANVQIPIPQTVLPLVTEIPSGPLRITIPNVDESEQKSAPLASRTLHLLFSRLLQESQQREVLLQPLPVLSIGTPSTSIIYSVISRFVASAASDGTTPAWEAILAQKASNALPMLTTLPSAQTMAQAFDLGSITASAKREEQQVADASPKAEEPSSAAATEPSKTGAGKKRTAKSRKSKEKQIASNDSKQRKKKSAQKKPAEEPQQQADAGTAGAASENATPGAGSPEFSIAKLFDQLFIEDRPQMALPAAAETQLVLAAPEPQPQTLAAAEPVKMSKRAARKFKATMTAAKEKPASKPVEEAKEEGVQQASLEVQLQGEDSPDEAAASAGSGNSNVTTIALNDGPKTPTEKARSAPVTPVSSAPLPWQMAQAQNPLLGKTELPSQLAQQKAPVHEITTVTTPEPTFLARLLTKSGKEKKQDQQQASDATAAQLAALAPAAGGEPPADLTGEVLVPSTPETPAAPIPSRAAPSPAPAPVQAAPATPPAAPAPEAAPPVEQAAPAPQPEPAPAVAQPAPPPPEKPATAPAPAAVAAPAPADINEEKKRILQAAPPPPAPPPFGAPSMQAAPEATPPAATLTAEQQELLKSAPPAPAAPQIAQAEKTPEQLAREQEEKAKAEADKIAQEAKLAAEKAATEKTAQEKAAAEALVASPPPDFSGKAKPPSAKELLANMPQQLTKPAESRDPSQPFVIDRTKAAREIFDPTNPEELQKAKHEAIGVKIEIKTPRIDVNYELEKAYNALMSGQSQVAMEIYRNVLEADANNVLAMFGLATTYHRSGEFAQARSLYARILTLDTDNRDALNNFLALVSSEAPREALTQLEKLEAKNPEFSPIPAQMAVIYQKLGNVDKAIQKMLRAVSLEPENLTYRYNLAVLMDRQGKRDEAAALYRQLVSAHQKGALIPGNIRQIQERLTFLSSNHR